MKVAVFKLAGVVNQIMWRMSLFVAVHTIRN